MTNKELVQAMRTVLIRPNMYRNEFPYNCGYYDGHFISGDCWNIIKAICWDSSIVDNYTVGKYSYTPNADLGDWDGETILAHCKEKGTNIKDAPIGAFLLYEDGTHAGIYLGNMQAIEMTAGWNAYCMLISEIGPNGERTKDRVQIGRWKAWGKLPTVEYLPEKDPLKVGDTVKLRSNTDVNGTLLNMEYLSAHKLVVQKVDGNKIYVKRPEYPWTECVMYDDDVEKVEDNSFKVGDRVKLVGSKDVNGTALAKAWLNLRKLEIQSFWPDGSVVVGQVGKSYAECVMNPAGITKI